MKLKGVCVIMKSKFKNILLIQLLPFIVFVISIIIMVFLKRASLKTFWICSFTALVVAYIVNEKNESFSKKCIEGFQNKYLASCVLIFILSGILSNILKTTGLSDALVALFFNIGVNSNFLLLIFFVICCIISTICGTSTGTISFSVPLFVPIAVKYGINPYLCLGAIASGSFFGDHLSPISDTTLISVNAMECDMYKMMKQRTIIAIIVFILACAIYIFIGFNYTSTIASDLSYSSSLKPLILMIIPIFMIIVLKKTRDVLSCLVFTDLFSIILSIVLGFTNINELFSSNSCIIAGIESVIGVVFFLIMLFTMLNFIPQDKVNNAIENAMKKVKNPLLINLFSCLIIILFMLGVSNNTAAMSIESSFINKLFKNKTPEEKANIFDALSVGISGVLPYNTAFMLMIALSLDNGINSSEFSILRVPMFSFSCILFIIIYIYIALRKGKKVVKS